MSAPNVDRLQVVMPKRSIQELDELCNALDVNRSFLVRLACAKLLEEWRECGRISIGSKLFRGV